MNDLIIRNLHASIDNKKILNGIDLEIKENEVTVLMGPNGSGKSTLAYIIMGHPDYKVEQGEIIYKGQNVLELSPDKRAKLGLFLSFQYPNEIPGVSISNFLRTALNARLEKPIPVGDFRKMMKEKFDLLKIDMKFAMRYLNQGFSGGEKKKAEILQLAILQPDLAILDETDSGLDIDALKIVADGINKVRKTKKIGVLLITHYQRILNYIKPDKVYVMVDGKIVKQGTAKLALKLEELGYDWVKEKKIK